MADPRGDQPDRQRQIAAQPGHLGDRAVARLQTWAGGQADEQVRGLAGWQRVEADRRRLLQRGQPAAAGDQNQAARRPRQQRANLIGVGGVIQHQQHFLAGQVVAPQRRPRLQARRDPLRRDAGGEQQGGERFSRVDRPLSRSMRMQAKEDLPVGEAGGELVGGVHGERGLADPGHPVHRVDADHPRDRRCFGDRGHQPVQLAGTPSERGRVARQRAQRHCWLPARCLGTSRQALQHRLAGWVQLIRQADPADRRGLLHGHRHGAIGGLGGDRAVPDDLLEEPRRGDDRQHTRRPGQRFLERASVQKPERQVDRRRGHPMLVVVDLPGVQRHPQPDPLLARMRAVVRAQLRRQRGRQRFHQQALGHLGGNQDRAHRRLGPRDRSHPTGFPPGRTLRAWHDTGHHEPPPGACWYAADPRTPQRQQRLWSGERPASGPLSALTPGENKAGRNFLLTRKLYPRPRNPHRPAAPYSRLLGCCQTGPPRLRRAPRPRGHGRRNPLARLT